MPPLDSTMKDSPAVTEQFRCGHVAVTGQPNVGKSTLINQIVGQKLCITSRKPQTTRHRILGIKTDERAQVIYVDTPGIHKGRARALNRYMNRTASGVIHEVDVVVLLVEALHWSNADSFVVGKLSHFSGPAILAVNKIDKVSPKERLFAFLSEAATRYDFAEIIPISARSGDGVDRLEECVYQHLPHAEYLYPRDQLTDRDEKFFAAEFVREHLTRRLGQELPYRLSVEIETFSIERGRRDIGAVIWVERAGQKAIVIGHGGEMLKSVGTQARRALEELYGGKVFLRLWVKVRSGWSDSERALQTLGYGK